MGGGYGIIGYFYIYIYLNANVNVNVNVNFNVNMIEFSSMDRSYE